MSSPSFSDRMTNRRPLPLPSLLFPLVLCHSSHSCHIACRTAPAQPSPKKKTFKQRPGTRTYGQKFGQVWQGNLSKQKHSIGQKKSQKLNNAGKLRGIYHIDPEDKEFNDPPENRRITLNCAWTPQCHVNCERQQGIHSKRRLRAHKTKFALSSGMERILAKNTRKKQTNYVTKVRPTTNLQESECKRPTTEIMKITLFKRCTIRRDIVILCTNLFLCSKQSWMRRPQLTKNGRAEELPITARIKSQKQTRSYRAVTEKSQKQFIVQRPWTYATSKTIDWTRSSKHIKAVLCNVATL